MKDGIVFHLSSRNQALENFAPLSHHHSNIVKFHRSVITLLIFIWVCGEVSIDFHLHNPTENVPQLSHSLPIPSKDEQGSQKSHKLYFFFFGFSPPNPNLIAQFPCKIWPH